MTSTELTAVLAELNTAGTPWFAVVPGTASRPAAQSVIDLTDPHLVPITVNPFEPAPRRPVHAHLERLATLVETAYRPPGPVRAVLRLALRQVYTEGGWDLAAGRALPGAVAPPWLPGIADLTRAASLAAADLGCGATVRAAVQAFCAGTLLPLWHGPAGRFLHGGHPPDLRAAVTGGVLFTAGAVGDADAAFLTGVMLYRLADELKTAAGPPEVVIAVPAVRLRRVLDDLAGGGVVVRHAAAEPGNSAMPGPGDVTALPAIEPPVPVALLGRRSAACGLQCRQRPCTDRELHRASRRAGHDSQVWLRLWTETLLLAFLTGNILPQVPHPLRRSLLPLDVRTRECALATLIDAGVARRARALRYSYDPARLTAVAASAAAGLLAMAPGGASPPATPGSHPFRAGQVWVIPQLRWLHEAERLTPMLGDQPAPGDIAPPLDFELAGLVDWPGIRVADRLEGLRCHQLSMDRAANRTLAMIALAGDDPHPLAEDIATAGIGRDHGQRLRYVARLLGTCPRGDGVGWLEEVLSWPSRLIGPAQAGLAQAGPAQAGLWPRPSAPAPPAWQAATG